jgi:hypothetical protein
VIHLGVDKKIIQKYPPNPLTKVRIGDIKNDNIRNVK